MNSVGLASELPSQEQVIAFRASLYAKVSAAMPAHAVAAAKLVVPSRKRKENATASAPKKQAKRAKDRIFGRSFCQYRFARRAQSVIVFSSSRHSMAGSMPCRIATGVRLSPSIAGCPVAADAHPQCCRAGHLCSTECQRRIMAQFLFPHSQRTRPCLRCNTLMFKGRPTAL